MKRYACDLDMAGQDVQELMVKQGVAWAYPQYSKQKYTVLEQQAHKANIDLWADETVISPLLAGTKIAKNPGT